MIQDDLWPFYLPKVYNYENGIGKKIVQLVDKRVNRLRTGVDNMSTSRNF